MILQFLQSLPASFSTEVDTNSCTGAAMVAARKMVVGRLLDLRMYTVATLFKNSILSI